MTKQPKKKLANDIRIKVGVGKVYRRLIEAATKVGLEKRLSHWMKLSIVDYLDERDRAVEWIRDNTRMSTVESISALQTTKAIAAVLNLDPVELAEQVIASRGED